MSPKMVCCAVLLGCLLTCVLLFLLADAACAHVGLGPTHACWTLVANARGPHAGRRLRGSFMSSPDRRLRESSNATNVTDVASNVSWATPVWLEGGNSSFREFSFSGELPFLGSGAMSNSSNDSSLANSSSSTSSLGLGLGARAPESLPSSSNPSLANPPSSNSSLGQGNLGIRGPGHCGNGWSARRHGADWHVDSDSSAWKHVNLNQCLSRCWKNKDCYCLTFEHDIRGFVYGSERHWTEPGTCFMHHKCDQARVERNVLGSETCIIRG